MAQHIVKGVAVELNTEADEYPTEAEKKMLAYLIWEKQGRPDGQDLNNYYESEKTLKDILEIGTPTGTVTI